MEILEALKETGVATHRDCGPVKVNEEDCLILLHEGGPAPLMATISSGWEPVPCDCKVCEAKSILHNKALSAQISSLVDTLIDAARCEREHH